MKHDSIVWVSRWLGCSAGLLGWAGLVSCIAKRMFLGQTRPAKLGAEILPGPVKVKAGHEW